MGPQIRTGALDAAGGIVDLAAACRASLLDEGLTPGAAARVSAALLPGDMVALIEGGARSLDAAREALEWAADGGAGRGDGVAGVHPAERLHFLPPVPRPPLLRDFMGFEQHLLNIYPKLGREIPPEWYKLPVYYKGNPGSLATHGDDIPIPSYATALDIEFELAMVIGRGGINIPAERALRARVRLHDLQRFQRADDPGPRNVGRPRPGQGQGLRARPRARPYLVTADEMPDIYNLRMVARVNGEEWCETNSGTIHWTFEQMIAHASTDEFLRPGRDPGLGHGRRRFGRRARHAARPRRRRGARGRAPWHAAQSGHLMPIATINPATGETLRPSTR